MTVRVEFYAALRDLTGREEIDFNVADGATVADLLQRIFAEIPGLADWDSRLLIAADLDYVERTHILRPGEVVSIMPPVQGG